MMECNVILFDGFETLDAFGPAEIIGKLPGLYSLAYFSRAGGLVTSSQNIRVQTCPFEQMKAGGILLIPGGVGTRALVEDKDFTARLAKVAEAAAYVLTVCTGSALLAQTGLLSRKRATSNKRAFEWVQSLGQGVLWVRQARWVVDGRFYTSSGVSAGIDMTLGFLADCHGEKAAREVADAIEYIWNCNKNSDPFAFPAKRSEPL